MEKITMSDLPSIRRLGAKDYVSMPWKNGGGVTTELLLSPAGASLAGGFDWRLSVAELKGSGPFSALPGVERGIVQLEGPAMRLTHAGRPGRALTPFEPYRFAGEWETAAELAGPARDFNVMAARDRVTARVDSLALKAGSTLRLAPGGEVVVFCAEGWIGVQTANSGVMALLRHELVWSAAGELAVTAPADAVALVVGFERKA
jgi:environmental stress-induced protein Ves